MGAKKILIICDAMTEPLYTPRVRYLCRALEENGFDVELISEKSGGVPFDFLFKHREIEFYNGGKLDWVLKNVASVVYDYKNRWFTRKISEIAERDYDLVLSSTFHTFGLRAGLKIAKKNGVPLIVDLRDIAEQCEDNEYSRGLASRFAFLGRLYRSLNIRRRNRVLRQAACLTTVSPWHVSYLKRYNDNVELIYNGYDESMFNGMEVRTDSFDIVYAGKWYGERMQDPTLLFEALRELKTELKEMRMVWYTNDEVHCELKNRAKEYGVEDIMEIRGFVPNDEVPMLLNAASMVLVLTNVGTHGIVTTKFFEAMGVEKPVLCLRSDEGVLEDMIKEVNMGWACRNVEEVKKALIQAYEEWKTEGFTKVSVVEREKFSRKRQTEKMIGLINDKMK